VHIVATSPHRSHRQLPSPSPGATPSGSRRLAHLPFM
jgi:hypothetical protein